MKRFNHVIIVYPAVIVLYYVTIGVMGITCPIKAAFGTICPACGMTRAMLSLVRCDVEGYLSYNAMALPVLTAVLLMFFREKMKHGNVAFAFGTGILIINFFYYLFRLKNGIII